MKKTPKQFPKLSLPKADIFDPGKLRYGDACLTADFPEVKKPTKTG